MQEGYAEVAFGSLFFTIPKMNMKQTSGLWVFYHPNKSITINEVIRHTKNINPKMPLQEEKFNKQEFEEYIQENQLDIGNIALTSEVYKNLL